MTDNISSTLAAAPVVPLVQSNDPETALHIANALIAGGLTVLEVVLRTEAAFECMTHLVEHLPAGHVGAGTVVTPAQAEEVIAGGAAFVVSPGLDPDVVRCCQSADIPVFPGVVTATELTAAYNLGLRTVKFFPAALAGGPTMLKALSSVFADVQFMPTGGVNAENLAEYLAVRSVIGCGGTWLTPAAEIADGNFDAITALAKQALAIASP